MLMTHQQAAELSEPRIGSLHDPTALVAPQFASIFVTPLPVVLAVRRNQFDASLLQSPTQRVGVVGAIGNHALGLLPRAAFAPRDADFSERGFRKRNFCRRGTFQPNSQRKTLNRLPKTSRPLLTFRPNRPISSALSARHQHRLLLSPRPAGNLVAENPPHRPATCLYKHHSSRRNFVTGAAKPQSLH